MPHRNLHGPRGALLYWPQDGLEGLRGKEVPRGLRKLVIIVGGIVRGVVGGVIWRRQFHLRLWHGGHVCGRDQTVGGPLRCWCGGHHLGHGDRDLGHHLGQGGQVGGHMRGGHAQVLGLGPHKRFLLRNIA